MSEPTLEDLFVRMVADETATKIGAVPAQVVSYTAATQRCDAQPLIRVQTDGSGELRQLPVCRDVPVRWPSGGGAAPAGPFAGPGTQWAITGPLVAGDTVWLRPAGGDISAWSRNGTANAVGTAPRRGSLSDVVAEPGTRPITDPLTSDQYSASALVVACASVLLGDSTASDRVALASLVFAELAKIETAINTHTHQVAGVQAGPTTLSTAVGSASYTKPTSATNIGATRVYAI